MVQLCNGIIYKKKNLTCQYREIANECFKWKKQGANKSIYAFTAMLYIFFLMCGEDYTFACIYAIAVLIS